jgi:glucose/arabinose dehydrogenase
MKKLNLGLILMALFLCAVCPALGRIGASPFPQDQESPEAIQAIQLQPFLSGLSSPVHITSSKDGTRRLFVVEKPGTIKVVQPGSTTPTVFLNISSLVLSTSSEQGLLGLAFHPSYATNRRFFVYYTRQTDGAIVIAEYHTSTADPNMADPLSAIPLLSIPHPGQTNHNGGMMAFGPDNFLYIGTGDGGSANDPPNNAQNINALLGKILRIDVDTPNGSIPYSSPPSNPFFGATAGADEIYAYGMRNPWRFSFDKGGTHQLYVADVGQGAREEIDIVTLGGNFGWRIMEGTICNPNFNGGVCTPPSGHIPPIAEYGHTGGRCSITGGYVYRGSGGAVPVGAYIYADFCTGEIFQLVGSTQTLLQDTTLSISSFGEDDAGELYVVGLGGTNTGTVQRLTNPDQTLGLYRSSSSTFYLRNTNSVGLPDISVAFGDGPGGDVPIVGDWDGNGTVTIGVYRPSTSTFYLKNSNTAGLPDITVAFGDGPGGDIPLVGDWDGNGTDTIGVYRPGSSTFYLRNTNGTGFPDLSIPFGAMGDKPLVGDWNGDGTDTIGLYRSSSSTFYLRNTNSVGLPDISVAFGDGPGGDIPLVGDWDGNGTVTIGVYRPGNFTFYLRNSTSAGLPDLTVPFGGSGDKPLAGNWGL